MRRGEDAPSAVASRTGTRLLTFTEPMRIGYFSAMSAPIRLIRPTVDLKHSFLEGLAEFQLEALPWMMDIRIDDLRMDFEKFVVAQLNKKTWWTKDVPVDETELWAVQDDIYVGRISIRHALNADLRLMGGHIGYDTRPSFRGRGIGSAMLSLALPVARQIGIREALLTCNDTNAPSIRIIEKHGGILQEIKPQFDGGGQSKDITGFGSRPKLEGEPVAPRRPNGKVTSVLFARLDH